MKESPDKYGEYTIQLTKTIIIFVVAFINNSVAMCWYSFYMVNNNNVDIFSAISSVSNIGISAIIYRLTFVVVRCNVNKPLLAADLVKCFCAIRSRKQWRTRCCRKRLEYVKISYSNNLFQITVVNN